MLENTSKDGICTEEHLLKSEYGHLRFHYDMEAFKIKATAVLFLIVMIFEVILYNTLHQGPITPVEGQKCGCNDQQDKGLHMIIWPLLLLMIGFIIVGFLCQYKIRKKMDYTIAH